MNHLQKGKNMEIGQAITEASKMINQAARELGEENTEGALSSMLELRDLMDGPIECEPDKEPGADGICPSCGK